MANTTKAEIGTEVADGVRLEAAIDNRVANMRRVLGDLTELSDADALRVLRDSFPDATLSERVRALRSSRH